ncbi:MAG TPA: FAD-binding protein [Lentzea sp.]
MSGLSRRALLQTTALAGAAVAVSGGSAGASSDLIRIGPADPRYDSLRVGYNRRFDVRPEQIIRPRSAEEVARVVESAVSSGKRVGIYGGGHCFEDFVFSPDHPVIVHMGSMTDVGFDARRGVYSVGGGARLLNVYERLWGDHGVTVPGGVCYSVGAGGHVTGGGFGLLSRLHGLTVDHLAGVEVVTVDARGRANVEYVTRQDTGARGDLFWAHTGGGGGNFGVVTRFDFRSPDERRYPRGLVEPPATVTLVSPQWSWDGVDAARFSAFITEFSLWCKENFASGGPSDAVFPWLIARHRGLGGLGVVLQIASGSRESEAVARKLVRRLAVALGQDDSGVPWTEMPWLNAVKTIGTGSVENTDPNMRGKQGSANFRGVPRAEQLEAMYTALTTDIPGSASAGIDISAMGGAIGAVPPDATAVYSRQATMRFLIQTFWRDKAFDQPNIDWLRRSYRSIFASTGGVPIFDDVTSGSYVNYPNADLSSPEWNTSGLPAGDLYYGGNYGRLRQVKSAWDPRGFFAHRQSVEGK